MSETSPREGEPEYHMGWCKYEITREMRRKRMSRLELRIPQMTRSVELVLPPVFKLSMDGW